MMIAAGHSYFCIGGLDPLDRVVDGGVQIVIDLFLTRREVKGVVSSCRYRGSRDRVVWKNSSSSY